MRTAAQGRVGAERGGEEKGDEGEHAANLLPNCSNPSQSTVKEHRIAAT